MSYWVYNTKGVILAKKDFGEADRLYLIFTEKFGMIKAVAQGVRYLKSKLRYNLDLFSLNNLSLVSTKEGWRIIDVEEIDNLKKVKENNIKLKIFSNIAAFLIKMIKGEERNDFIWFSLLRFLEKVGERDEEIFFVANILKNLGYLPENNLPRDKLLVAINRAIRESML